MVGLHVKEMDVLLGLDVNPLSVNVYEVLEDDLLLYLTHFICESVFG